MRKIGAFLLTLVMIVFCGIAYLVGSLGTLVSWVGLRLMEGAVGIYGVADRLEAKRTANMLGLVLAYTDVYDSPPPPPPH